jgi:tetratricopeptide (TPR) repeat protein
MTLDDELDRIFATRDRNNMQPTIDALLPLYASNPENARVLYEVGGAYDTAGQEDIARGFYEKALAAGLEGDLLRRCYVQYGSTLRNVGEYVKSREVFREARRTFPESPALVVFDAITLHAAGQPNASIAELLDLAVNFVRTPDLERYKPAISGNAAPWTKPEHLVRVNRTERYPGGRRHSHIGPFQGTALAWATAAVIALSAAFWVNRTAVR